MGASATHLSKFDKVQKLAEGMSGGVFPALQSCYATSYRLRSSTNNLLLHHTI